MGVWPEWQGIAARTSNAIPMDDRDFRLGSRMPPERSRPYSERNNRRAAVWPVVASAHHSAACETSADDTDDVILRLSRSLHNGCLSGRADDIVSPHEPRIVIASRIGQGIAYRRPGSRTVLVQRRAVSINAAVSADE
jgi:hypothetical protein